MDTDRNTSADDDAYVLSLVGDDRNRINENIKHLLISRKKTCLKIKAL
jgi:glycine cleavage system regulatory protein